jgi:hypothetical protein
MWHYIVVEFSCGRAVIWRRPYSLKERHPNCEVGDEFWKCETKCNDCARDAESKLAEPATQQSKIDRYKSYSVPNNRPSASTVEKQHATQKHQRDWQRDSIAATQEAELFFDHPRDLTQRSQNPWYQVTLPWSLVPGRHDTTFQIASVAQAPCYARNQLANTSATASGADANKTTYMSSQAGPGWENITRTTFPLRTRRVGQVVVNTAHEHCEFGMPKTNGLFVPKTPRSLKHKVRNAVDRIPAD